MVQFFELVKRNMKIYLRDKGAVFFSLLSMLIVLMLMLFFLGDMSIRGLTDILEEMPWRDAAQDAENAELFVMLWTCAGIVSINAPTVTLAVYSSMIKDRTEGKLGSICTAPVSRFTICSAYVCAAWISSVIICTITLAISEIYCIIKGGDAFSVQAHLRLLGVICVNSFTYAAMLYFAAALTKTQGAWSSIGTVIGTLVGFLGGIYIPIGTLSDTIGSILKMSPVIYGTKVFRSIMTEDLCVKMFDSDKLLPADFKPVYLEEMGVELEVFDEMISNTESIILLAVWGAVFLIAGAFATKTAMKYDR